jgi:hypothetical protein
MIQNSHTINRLDMLDNDMLVIVFSFLNIDDLMASKEIVRFLNGKNSNILWSSLALRDAMTRWDINNITFVRNINVIIKNHNDQIPRLYDTVLKNIDECKQQFIFGEDIPTHDANIYKKLCNVIDGTCKNYKYLDNLNTKEQNQNNNMLDKLLVRCWQNNTDAIKDLRKVTKFVIRSLIRSNLNNGAKCIAVLYNSYKKSSANTGRSPKSDPDNPWAEKYQIILAAISEELVKNKTVLTETINQLKLIEDFEERVHKNSYDRISQEL